MVDLIDDLPHRRLVAALLLRAVRDARRGDASAARWLAGPEAAAWAAWLDLDVDPVDWPPVVAVDDSTLTTEPGA